MNKGIWKLNILLGLLQLKYAELKCSIDIKWLHRHYDMFLDWHYEIFLQPWGHTSFYKIISKLLFKFQNLFLYFLLCNSIKRCSYCCGSGNYFHINYAFHDINDGKSITIHGCLIYSIWSSSMCDFSNTQFILCDSSLN